MSTTDADAVETGDQCCCSSEADPNQNAHVYLVPALFYRCICRPMLHQGNTACEDIRRRVPGAKVQTLPLDLESFDSVRTFVETFRETGLPLHVLVNNAGTLLFEAVLGIFC